jgi:indolepyruvate ferredoxin oxidoreductase beta subunit
MNREEKNTEDNGFDLVLVGVGGQGIVMLSNAIGYACAEGGIKAITGELHGLSQRSGTIYIHMRIGGKNISPLIPYGEADAIIALEAMEALRYIEYIKESGVIIMNKRMIHPVTEIQVLLKEKRTDFIELDEILQKVKVITSNIALIDGLALATQAGNPLTENSVFIGALSALTEVPLPLEAFKKGLEQAVPKKALEQNLKAFDLGNKAAYEGLCQLVSCREL